MIWLGLDIGGTNTKAALFDDSSASIAQHESFPTDRTDALAAVGRAAEVASGWLERFPQIAGVGVTIPGHFDPLTGQATVVPNIPGNWSGLPVKDIIATRVQRPVALINDARAFALAESRLGAARAFNTVVALVLGTGVGGAIILNGDLYLGSGGATGEIGHMVLKVDGPLCGCGNRGCLESLTRAETIAAAAGASTVAEAVRMARTGDERARTALEKAATWIGLGLANLTTVLTPDAIVVGGGMAQAGDLLFRPLRDALAARSPLVPPATYRVVCGDLGTQAGAIGAAIMMHDASVGRTGGV